MEERRGTLVMSISKENLDKASEIARLHWNTMTPLTLVNPIAEALQQSSEREEKLKKEIRSLKAHIKVLEACVEVFKECAKKG